MIRRTAIFLIPVALLVAADRLFKILAQRFLMDAEPLILIDGVLELRLVHNTGAAFGLLRGLRPLFIVISVLVVLYCFILFLRMPERRIYYPFMSTLIFISAGALGNLIDRLIHPYVVDFIYFSLIDFPVFNFADILVTCSCFFLVYIMIFSLKDEDIAGIPFRIWR